MKIYPELSVTHIKKPSRLYAFPILGMFIKIVILIPVFLEMIVLFVYGWVLSVINSFCVLANGTYWRYSYEFHLGFSRFSAKLQFFVFGLTDSYPGFDFKLKNEITLDFDYPKNPNRLFAIPFLGAIARFLLLIPYFFYSGAITTGARLGVFVTFAPVLFNGKYPESTYELARDSYRVMTSSTLYMLGISDSYPSFKISMNHKKIKITLIVVGILLSLLSNLNSSNRNHRTQIKNPPVYNNTF